MSLNDYKLGLKNKKRPKVPKGPKGKKQGTTHSECQKQTVHSKGQTGCLNSAQTQVQALPFVYSTIFYLL